MRWCDNFVLWGGGGGGWDKCCAAYNAFFGFLFACVVLLHRVTNILNHRVNEAISYPLYFSMCT